MGLAALRDAGLARQYGDVVRQELAAVGIRQVLYPQVDLATEPRWGRTGLSMGENANLTTSLMLAMLDGFRGAGGDTKGSVIATVKHFLGAGPMENGEDAHFPWGKNTTYPGNNLPYHLTPFKAAIAAGAPQIMPYYSRPKGIEAWDNIGFAFNKPVITDLLREDLGFEGIVLTDFGILTHQPWGLEDKTVLERTLAVLEAGCDIIGGESSPENIVTLVHEGAIEESRIDTSVRKLMRQQFELGLFDNPFANETSARLVVGKEESMKLGSYSQQASLTLVVNKETFLPLQWKTRPLKVYAEGIASAVLEKRGLTVVNTTEESELAILRLASPFSPSDPEWPAAAAINNGSLAYTLEEQQRQTTIYEAVPTIVDIKLQRPAVMPEIVEKASAVFVNYGSSDDALLDVIFNVNDADPKGKLPFDLPSSMAAVEASFEDLPFDTADPLFNYGHELSYRWE